jgi:hypothetical protein
MSQLAKFYNKIFDYSLKKATHIKFNDILKTRTIIDNKDKLAGGTDQVDPQEDQVSQNAKKCGWLKTDGSADVEGYRNSNWKCPKSGKRTGGTGGGSYKDCFGTYTKGCKSEVIRKVQGCLGGLTTDGKFGDNTQKALVAKGYPNGFTDADVNKICNVQTSPEVPSPETPRAEFNQNDWL